MVFLREKRDLDVIIIGGEFRAFAQFIILATVEIGLGDGLGAVSRFYILYASALLEAPGNDDCEGLRIMETKKMKKFIRFDREDFIGVITIDNPPENSLASDVLSEFEDTLDEVLPDKLLRTLIITGSGEKIFVSGAEINELAYLDKAGGIHVASRVKDIFSKLWFSPKPVFCAINGHALGGGLELTLHCDFRIAIDKARFGQPEINLGVLPGAGGTQLLPRLIGLSKARWLLFSGETISADEALSCGLIDRVVKSKSLIKITKEMARQIAEKPPLAIKAVKKMLRLVQSPGLDEAMESETEMFGELCATEDKREGILAFLEKRKANFQGK